MFLRLLVVLNHLPYDIQLSFMPNGNVVNVKYQYLGFFKVQVYLLLHEQKAFSMHLRFKLKLLNLLVC